MSTCFICQMNSCDPYTHEDVFRGHDGGVGTKDILHAMYGDAYKYKTACNPVACCNEGCNALVHRECLWDWFDNHKTESGLWPMSRRCGICSSGEFTSRPFRLMLREEKEQLMRVKEEEEAKELGRLEKFAREHWKKQYLGQQFKIEENENCFVGIVSKCLTNTFTEESEVEWLISFDETRQLQVPHCLLGNGTDAIKVSDCVEVQSRSRRRRASAATPCANQECEYFCYGKFCSKSCERIGGLTGDEEDEEDAEDAQDVSIPEKQFKSANEVIAEALGEWEKNHSSNVHEVEEEVQEDGVHWKAFLKKRAKERAAGLEAEEYDGDTWEILGETMEHDTCTCPPNKPVHEKRHASVKFGTLMKDYPELKPEKVREKQSQYARDKEKKFCLYDTILTVLIHLFFPIAFLKTLALQVNAHVDLQHKRYEQAYKVKHVDEDGHWLDLKEADMSEEHKAYQRSKTWYQTWAKKKEDDHVEYTWCDILVYLAILIGTGLIPFYRRSDAWKKDGDGLIPDLKNVMSARKWKRLHHYMIYCNVHEENEKKYWKKTPAPWSETPDISHPKSHRAKEPKPEPGYTAEEDDDRERSSAWYHKAKDYLNFSLSKHFNNIFKMIFEKYIFPGGYFAFDESMAKYKGQDSRKTFMPNKPIKHGIKIWCLCISGGPLHGFCIQYKVAQSVPQNLKQKYERLHVPGLKGIGSLVFRFCKESLFDTGVVGCCVYGDQAFSGVSLALALLSIGVLYTGTLQSNRIPVETPWTDDGDTYYQLKEMKASQYQQDSKLCVKRKRHHLYIQRWKDKSETSFTNVISTAHSLCTQHDHAMHSRYNLRQQSPQTFLRWIGIQFYNIYMCAVDSMDFLAQAYSFSRRASAKKGDGRLCDWMLDQAFANMYKLFLGIIFVSYFMYGYASPKDCWSLSHHDFLCLLMTRMIDMAVEGGDGERYVKPSRRSGRKRGRVRVVSSLRLSDKQWLDRLEHVVTKTPIYTNAITGKRDRRIGRCACCHSDFHSKKSSIYYCHKCSHPKAGEKRNEDGKWQGNKITFFCSHECANHWHTNNKGKLKWCGRCRKCKR